MTVFPDPSGENEDVPGTQIIQERQTNLQKMAQPAQVLKAAVQNLVNYQVLDQSIPATCTVHIHCINYS